MILFQFELITKNDDCLVVSLYLKKFESPEKCMVVVESIDRREALVSRKNYNVSFSCL